jgi:hypothetical protein
VKEPREGRFVRVGLFSIIDVFTSRRMLLFQQRHPKLYWVVTIPPLILTITVLLAALAWWNGDLRF